jgi:molecular chaperone DnaJ
MKWREIPTKYTDRLAELRIQLDRDPYLVLGIPSAASDEEVTAAYRRSISTYHPDRQGEFLRSYAQEVSKIINLAYAQICERRKS